MVLQARHLSVSTDAVPCEWEKDRSTENVGNKKERRGLMRGFGLESSRFDSVSRILLSLQHLIVTVFKGQQSQMALIFPRE